MNKHEFSNEWVGIETVGRQQNSTTWHEKLLLLDYYNTSHI